MGVRTTSTWRSRRPTTAEHMALRSRRAAERLMRVDAALISPELEWLTTKPEKLAYLAVRTARERSESPGELAVQERPDLFPGTFPIGVDATGRAALLYVVTVP